MEPAGESTLLAKPHAGFVFFQTDRNIIVLHLQYSDGRKKNTDTGVQGRIIHEAGEAEASGPAPLPNLPVQQKFSTTLGPEISREKIAVSVNNISKKIG